VTADGAWEFGTLEPGDTVMSDVFENPVSEFGPIVLAVEKSDPSVPGEPFNVALTVFRVDQKVFLIAATNVSRLPIGAMVVRWWAFAV
jgi:hypothetical protein